VSNTMAYSFLSDAHIAHYIKQLMSRLDELTPNEVNKASELVAEAQRRLIACPRPDLVGKLIFKPFNMNDGTVRYFTGRVRWDKKFLITYDDNSVYDTTIAEIEHYRMTLKNCFDWIEVSGGRHKSFGKCLKILTNNNFSLVRNAYRSLGLLVDVNHPWPCLGSHEFEKVENAKKVIEYVFCN